MIIIKSSPEPVRSAAADTQSPETRAPNVTFIETLIRIIIMQFNSDSYIIIIIMRVRCTWRGGGECDACACTADDGRQTNKNKWRMGGG